MEVDQNINSAQRKRQGAANYTTAANICQVVKMHKKIAQNLAELGDLPTFCVELGSNCMNFHQF